MTVLEQFQNLRLHLLIWKQFPNCFQEITINNKKNAIP